MITLKLEKRNPEVKAKKLRRHDLSSRLVLPGHVRQAVANNLSHKYFPPFGCYKVIFILFSEKVKYFCSIL